MKKIGEGGNAGRRQLEERRRIVCAREILLQPYVPLEVKENKSIIKLQGEVLRIWCLLAQNFSYLIISKISSSFNNRAIIQLIEQVGNYTFGYCTNIIVTHNAMKTSLLPVYRNEINRLNNKHNKQWGHQLSCLCEHPRRSFFVNIFVTPHSCGLYIKLVHFCTFQKKLTRLVFSSF